MTNFPGMIRALANVRFIVVGGVAAIAHGATRLTQDFDVAYARDTENLRALATALSPHAPYLRGAPPGLPFVFDERTLSQGLNFTLETALGDVDLLGEIVGGGGYDALEPHSIELELYGVRCKCLDLPTLIHVKRAAGRPKDLDAVAELEEILRERRA